MPAPKLEEILASSSGAPRLDEILAPSGPPAPTGMALVGPGYDTNAAIAAGIQSAKTEAPFHNLASGLLSNMGSMEHTGANLFLVLDHAAKVLSEHTGLSYGGAFQQVESVLRPHSEAMMVAAQQLSRGDSIADRAMRLIGGLPPAVAEAMIAVQMGGPVAGFAALGALQRADQGPVEAAKGALTGGLLGSIFKVTEVATPLTRAAAVASGSAAIDIAERKPTSEVALSSAANAIAAGLGARPPRKLSNLQPEPYPGAETQAIEPTQPKPRLRRTGTLAPVPQRPPLLEITDRTRETATEFLGRDYSDITPPDKVPRLNLRHFTGPDDVKAVMADMAEFYKDRIDQAKRGVITHDQTLRLAQDVGLLRPDYTPAEAEGALAYIQARRKGQAFNAEEVTAARMAVRTAAEDLKLRIQRIRAGNASDVEKAEFLNALAVTEDITAQALGGLSESARATSAARIRVGHSTLQMVELRRLISEFKGPRGMDLEKFADLLDAQDTPAGLVGLASQWRGATTGQKLMTLWINNLFSTLSIARNGLGNSFMAGWAPVHDAGAAAIGDVLAIPKWLLLAEPLPKDRVLFREAFAKLTGLVDGTGDGLRLAAKVWKTQTPQSPSDLFGTPPTTIEGGPARIGTAPDAPALTKAAAAVATVNSRTLLTMDAFAQAMAYRQQIRADAAHMAWAEGKKGAAYTRRVEELGARPTEAMQARALDFAYRQTFTEKLGLLGSRVQALANVPVVKVFVPFTRTPINIAKQSIRFSPVAPFLPEVARELFKQTGAARDRAIAQLALGSAAMGWFAAQAALGNITGSPPADPKLRDQWLLTHKPFSIKAGNDWIYYGGLEPVATLVGLSADYADIAGHVDDMTRQDLATALAWSFRQNLSNKLFLRGFSNLIEAISEPQNKLEKLVRDMGGSIVPGNVAQVARYLDPVVRDTRTAIDKIKSRIPGQSQSIPAKTNAIGEPIQLGGGLGPDLVSPLFTAPQNMDRTLSEVSRVNARIQMPEVGARLRHGIQLSAQEYQDLMMDYGPLAKLAWDRFVSSPTYESTPDHLKRKIFEDLYNDQKHAGLERAYLRVLQVDPVRVQQGMESEIRREQGLPPIPGT